jgi:hypothetical protein
MSCQQIIDEVADDRVRFVAELGHNPANECAAARVPLQINRAMGIVGAVDLGPAVRASGLFGPDFNEAKFLIQLRIAHDFVAQRSAPGRDHLNHRLHDPLRFSSDDYFCNACLLCSRRPLGDAMRGFLMVSAPRFAQRSRYSLIDQRAEHDVNIDISFLGMPKRAGQCTDDLESQLVP